VVITSGDGCPDCEVAWNFDLSFSSSDVVAYCGAIEY
jgi:2-hydroxy-3-keto-5-methylthiopentenyl-1-phosphate phosphatase